MAVIILTDDDVYTPLQQAETAAVLLFVLFLNYVMLLLSEPILRIIGRQGASILVRVMGIILAALAVQLVMNALGIGVWATVK
jgi:multiple antibiotic resistance protein